MKRPGLGVASGAALAVVGVGYTLMVVASLLIDLRQVRKQMLERAHTEVSTLFELNLAFRRWSAAYGGVYVPLTEVVQPNPYLANFARRDLVATDGTRLTLVNPAMMTREAHTILTGIATRPILNKVTSLKFVNPANAPDAWETAALRALETGRDEVSELAELGGQPYMRLLRPLVTEASCLECHAWQNYRLGDVRGALSIGLPMHSYLQHLARERQASVLSHLLIWFIGLGGVGVLGLLARRAERSYGVEREFTETAMSAMQGLFFVIDDKGRVVRWNRELEEFWEGPVDTLEGREVAEVVYPADRERLAAALSRSLREGSADAEARLLRRGGGEPRHYYLSCRSMAVEGLVYVVVSGVDLTARKGMEDELRAAAVEWGATFDAIHDAILILEPDQRVLRCNAAAVRLLRRPEGEIVGRDCWSLLHGDRPPESWPVSLAVAGRRTASAVLELLGRVCTVAADPVLDAGGSVVKVVCIVSDVTQQRRLEAQLFQAQKMEAMGTLAGGVAHDFNNILSAIVGYASLLALKTGPEDPRRQYVENILASTERASSLTRSLLSFGRKQTGELRPVSLNALVAGFQNVLARLIGEDIICAITCAPSDLVVEADAGQIEQVLMNLVTNARDSMPQGGRLTVRTEEAIFDRDHGEIPRGAYAVLAVADTGLGMDAETQRHLFEPFFTTKEVGKGTGLGLSIVYGIVKRHGGAIHVYSEPGIGTTFKIFIPLSRSVPRAERAEPPPLRLPSGTGTVLLVEDDAQTNEVARVLLEEAGYAVLVAGDGEEGVRLFRANADRVDLVLSDLIMPRKSGLEAVEEMRRVRPGVEAVFMSGYAADVLEQKGLIRPGMRFLSKPLNPMELLTAVRGALGVGPSVQG